jgi:hypothetical protein
MASRRINMILDTCVEYIQQQQTCTRPVSRYNIAQGEPRPGPEPFPVAKNYIIFCINIKYDFHFDNLIQQLIKGLNNFTVFVSQLD